MAGIQLCKKVSIGAVGILWISTCKGELCQPQLGTLSCAADPESLSLCSGETELRSFSRIFIAELQRGFFEKHVWLSMWDRPPRSRFTRVQRATCCSLLVFLFLCANAVWYGMVGNVHLRCAVPSVLCPVPDLLLLCFPLGRAGQTLCLLQTAAVLVALSLPFPSQRIWDQDMGRRGPRRARSAFPLAQFCRAVC